MVSIFDKEHASPTIYSKYVWQGTYFTNNKASMFGKEYTSPTIYSKYVWQGVYFTNNISSMLGKEHTPPTIYYVCLARNILHQQFSKYF